jgi:nucleoside-diphosphate-sugar epimerase
MKVFVTGATGFVGKDLMNRLRAAKVEIVTAGRDHASDIVVDNIDGSTNWQAAHFFEVDSIIHLAAHVHKVSEPDMSRYFAVNRDGTVNLARAAAKVGVKQFVFMSSVKAMGEYTNLDQPFTRHTPCSPTDPYGQSKLEAEQALLQIGEETGMQIICLRPPLVYGPSVEANFHLLMKLIRLRIPLPLAGINNKRSLVFVGNLTDLILHCLHIRQANGSFLISDGQEMSTSDLIGEISRAMNLRPRLFYVPSMLLAASCKLPILGGIVRRLTESLQVDMQETIEELGWSPPYSASKGIYDTVEYFQRI